VSDAPCSLLAHPVAVVANILSKPLGARPATLLRDNLDEKERQSG
jgi:hypothetical protein